MANSLKEHNFFGFDATVVADSKNPFGDRLTTMVVTFPRIVLAEFNTHRMFSRNSASSRAIPFKKMIERVEKHPFIPIAFQQEHTGMQGSQYITDPTLLARCHQVWLDARDNAIDSATMLDGKDDHLLPEHEFLRLNVTKQICNRLLELFLWHTVICTSSEWENFFSLRCPQYVFQQEPKATLRSRKDYGQYFFEQFGTYPVGNGIKGEIDLIEWLKINKSHADIHISLAAEAMWDVYNESIPKELKAGEWHVPFEKEMDTDMIDLFAQKNALGDLNVRRAISVGTCARISFGNINPSDVPVEKNYEMYEDLKSKRHASPFEHVAQCMNQNEYQSYYKGKDANLNHNGNSDNWGWCDNFKGFISERHKLGI